MVLALGESRNFRLLMSRYRSREVSQLPKNGGQLCLLLSPRFAFFVKPWFDTTASHEHNSRLIQIKRSISLFRCKVVEIFEKWMVPDTRHRASLWLLWWLACTFRHWYCLYMPWLSGGPMGVPGWFATRLCADAMALVLRILHNRVKTWSGEIWTGCNKGLGNFNMIPENLLWHTPVFKD